MALASRLRQETTTVTLNPLLPPQRRLVYLLQHLTLTWVNRTVNGAFFFSVSG